MEVRKHYKVTDKLILNTYDFSEDIICVEVLFEGNQLGAFCSDRTHFEEWEEEDIRHLSEQHVQKYQTRQKKLSVTQRIRFQNVEVEYYPYSDDMICLDIYSQEGVSTGSFCVDRLSFDEWLEDETLLESIVLRQSKKVI